MSLKPMLSPEELVQKMKDDQGITFTQISDADAATYFATTDNYLRTASYRKNYQKYQKGTHEGKYINLDFSYLQELSILDSKIRSEILKMCTEIEHHLKVALIHDIQSNPTEDGYQIAHEILTRNPYIIKNIERSIHSNYTANLINKYFTVTRTSTAPNKRAFSSISDFSNCPIWVLMELLTFGDFIKCYEYYYDKHKLPRIESAILNMVKSLRNACAHNNCILTNLNPKTAYPPVTIIAEIRKITSIGDNQRKRKLTTRPLVEFAALLYVYSNTSAPTISESRVSEIKELFCVRLSQNKDFFLRNDLLRTSGLFVQELILYYFPDTSAPTISESKISKIKKLIRHYFPQNPIKR